MSRCTKHFQNSADKCTVLAVKQDKQVEEEKARKMEKERTLRDEELRALQQRLRANRSRSPTPTPPR
jgi:hypothetical protein